MLHSKVLLSALVSQLHQLRCLVQAWLLAWNQGLHHQRSRLRLWGSLRPTGHTGLTLHFLLLC